MDGEALLLGAPRDLLHRLLRRVLVGRPAPVEGDDRALVLHAHPAPAQIGCVGLATEILDPPGPVLDHRVEHRLGPAGTQQLRAVGADVGDRADRDHRPSLGRAAAAHAGDQAISPGDGDQQVPRPLGHVRVAGVLDDRGQGAVDVEQDRRAFGVSTERC